MGIRSCLLFLCLLACREAPLDREAKLRRFVGYWEFQSCVVRDNVTTYVQVPGCDRSAVPDKFALSVYEFDLDFRSTYQVDVVFRCPPEYAGYRYYFEWVLVDDRTLNLVDTAGYQSNRLGVDYLSGSGLSVTLVDPLYSPVLNLKKRP